MERSVITFEGGEQTAKAKTNITQVSHCRNLNGQQQLRLKMIMNPFDNRQTRHKPIANKCLAVHWYLTLLKNENLNKRDHASKVSIKSLNRDQSAL